MERWAEQVYQAQAQGQGQAQLAQTGRELLGEELAQETQRVMTRHSREDTQAVLRATRQVVAQAHNEQGSGVGHFIRPDGSLSAEGLRAVRARLDERTARSFSGQQGESDLAVLVAAGVTTSRGAGGPPKGIDSPSAPLPPRTPAQTGAHFASLNRFARLSEQAGLTPEQRQQLLREVGQEGKVSNELRREIELSLRRQPGNAAGLKVEDLVAGAQALPPTWQGPPAVRLPSAPRSGGASSRPADGQESVTDAKDSDKKRGWRS